VISKGVYGIGTTDDDVREEETRCYKHLIFRVPAYILARIARVTFLETGWRADFALADLLADPAQSDIATLEE
jgi:hypothetical protein